MFVNIYKKKQTVKVTFLWLYVEIWYFNKTMKKYLNYNILSKLNCKKRAINLKKNNNKEKLLVYMYNILFGILIHAVNIPLYI